MTDPRIADHAAGLEQQLVELVQQQRWAEEQGRSEDRQRLQAEIEAVQSELGETAERLVEG